MPLICSRSIRIHYCDTPWSERSFRRLLDFLTHVPNSPKHLRPQFFLAASSSRLRDAISRRVTYWPRSRSKTTSRVHCSPTRSFFQPRQLHQIDRAPKNPSHDPGKVKPKNSGDAGAPADGGKLAGCFVLNVLSSWPFRRARMFLPTSLPSRRACCAVGGYVFFDLGSATAAQSPTATHRDNPELREWN